MEQDIKILYSSLLNAWNAQNALGFSELFLEDGNVIGYDGSPLNGKKAIFEELERIFSHHPTSRFVYKIWEIREISCDTVLLRSVVGMVPRSNLNLIESVNALQSLIAVQKDGEWKIALFQNTPAAFHDRPEEVASLTAELKEVILLQIQV